MCKITIDIAKRDVVESLTNEQRSVEKIVHYHTFLRWVCEYDFDISEELTNGWEYFTVYGVNEDYKEEVESILIL